MFHVVLYEPEIPPNTGNIIRLCANTGAQLDLVGPLGFRLEDAQLRRAGLDYREWASVRTWADWPEWRSGHPGQRVWAFSTHGRNRYDAAAYRPGDALLFGPESRGLPATVRDSAGEARILRLPMQPRSRSLNLSNAVAVALYEAFRQNGFSGLD